MSEKLLCKSCVKYKDADTCITRTNAAGNKQVRCRECVGKIRVANKSRKVE